MGTPVHGNAPVQAMRRVVVDRGGFCATGTGAARPTRPASHIAPAQNPAHQSHLL